MSASKTDYQDLTAKWPEPVLITNIHGNVFATLLQHQAYIEAKWIGHITAEDVITSAKVYLEVIKKHPCPKLLNNKQQVTGDWSEANDWLEFAWLPDALTAGLQCIAHVYSDNMFSRLSAKDLVERFTPTIKIKNFHQLEAAQEWLNTCTIYNQAPHYR